MKKSLKQMIVTAVSIANQENLLPFPISCDIELEENKKSKHGDFSTNLAMKLARIQKMSPDKIAKIIITKIKDPNNLLKKIEIAKPGFINFFINDRAWHNILKFINEENHKYGSCNIGSGQRIQIEFVSSNPTGPLHIGHGRGAVIGNSMANILSNCGFNVQKEYYINDSGKQIFTLGLSVYLRIKSILNFNVCFPKTCYQGKYITSIAKDFIKEKNPLISKQNENRIIKECAKYASKKIINQIHNDLSNFGINFDCWFSEQSLYDSNKVKKALDFYRKEKFIYSQNKAQWFATSKFEDEKDRVVVKKDGTTTYFASDIAYHKDKFDRGFEKVINVWGADHHGYIPRVQAAIEAIGKKKKQFKVILVRLVNLLRNGKPVTMSTRTGEFITLKNVIDEVGNDAAKFLFLTRHHESSLDFDIELAKKKNNENPVYYVQYVHARICNILDKSKKNGFNSISWNSKISINLTKQEEIQLIKKMANFPETIKKACTLMEPHRVSFYLIELASIFHTYYNKSRVINDNLELTHARLYLILAVKKVIRNGLSLLGINSPKKM